MWSVSFQESSVIDDDSLDDVLADMTEEGDSAGVRDDVHSGEHVSSKVIIYYACFRLGEFVLVKIVNVD